MSSPGIQIRVVVVLVNTHLRLGVNSANAAGKIDKPFGLLSEHEGKHLLRL